jgi:hypothetical protein
MKGFGLMHLTSSSPRLSLALPLLASPLKGEEFGARAKRSRYAATASFFTADACCFFQNSGMSAR